VAQCGALFRKIDEKWSRIAHKANGNNGLHVPQGPGTPLGHSGDTAGTLGTGGTLETRGTVGELEHPGIWNAFGTLNCVPFDGNC
jgi:hypothetical protein